MNLKNDTKATLDPISNDDDLAAFMAAITRFLDEAEATFGPPAPDLTVLEREFLAPPEGAGAFLRDMVKLARQFNIESEHVSSAALLALLEELELLEKLETGVGRLRKLFASGRSTPAHDEREGKPTKGAARAKTKLS